MARPNMDGMILAAGFGKRLGRIGEETPKALLEVGGRTMLEHVAAGLVAAGADRILVNVHHHADRIARFVAANDLGAEMVLSIETERPLETGGALLHARDQFRRDGPILIQNVDILTDADLREVVSRHQASGALATMAVNERPSARSLLFDANGLFGRTDDRTGIRIQVREPTGESRGWAFAGIHVVSPTLLDLIIERGAFPILELYLRLAADGLRIEAASIDPAWWMEVGTPERLAAARESFGEDSSASAGNLSASSPKRRY